MGDVRLGMLSRRELVRAGMLGGLVVAAPGMFAGCTEEGEPRPKDAAARMRLVSSDVTRHAADPAAIGIGAASVLALGGGLYGQLVRGSGNVALSPYSAAVALGMTVNGAAGSTRDEMLEVLSGQDVPSLDEGLNALTAYVESLAGPVPHTRSDEVLLDSANQLFGQADFNWEPAFLDAVAASFGAGVREVDYAEDTERARTAINGWTAEQTHDRIPEIVPADVLDEYTRPVLVNALYFKASWWKPFDEHDTEDREFHLGSGETASVPMMWQEQVPYAEGDGWRAARLSYSGDLAMTVVLPDEGREADLDALVSRGGLPTAREDFAGEADLTLPRWEFRVGASLSAALRALGMRLAFDDERADFSGMTKEGPLFVKDVLQQVFIAVDEKGTEAAAATAVVMELTSLPPQFPPLVLDRPFVFVIHELEHGTPLFLGKVVDPRG